MTREPQISARNPRTLDLRRKTGTSFLLIACCRLG